MNPLERIQEMYAQLEAADVRVLEPLKMTREQWDWVKQLVSVQPIQTPGWGLNESAAMLLAKPVEIVDALEESTPYLEGWISWTWTWKNTLP